MIPASTAAAQFAVAHAVEEINCQSDSEPDKESDPGHRAGRLSISAMQRITPRIGKTGTNGTRNGRGRSGATRAKHVHTKTNQDKCKEGPDISQICQIADVR